MRRRVSFEDALKRYQATQDVEYLRVKVRGHFLHDKERYLYAPDERLGLGYHVNTPLMQPDNAVRAGQSRLRAGRR